MDVRSDDGHCGACGVACTGGQVCQNSACGPAADCRTGGSCGAGKYCDLSTGECKPGCASSAQCIGANEECDVATHACVCASGFHRCGTACVSNAAVSSCGARCTSCPSAPNGVAVCRNERCEIDCNPGARSCQGACVTCPTQGVAQSACAAAQCVATECAAGYRLCGTRCCAWQLETVSAGSGPLGLARTSSGVLMATYFTGSSSELHYGARGSSGWTDEQVAYGVEAALAVTPSGEPRVLYTSNSTLGGLWHGVRRNGAWTTAVVRNVTRPYLPNLTVSGGGLSYGCYVSDDRRVVAIWDSGSGFVYSAITLGGSSMPSGCQIRLDSANVPHVVYGRNDSVYRASFAGGSWTSNFVVAHAGNPAMALDGAGAAHLAFQDYTSRTLKYARPSGTSWTFETVDATTGSGAQVALELDGSGKAHLAYLVSGPFDLKYATEGPTGFTSSVVESNGAIGYHPRLVLDGAGNPVVLYEDFTQKQVRLAR